MHDGLLVPPPAAERGPGAAGGAGAGGARLRPALLEALARAALAFGRLDQALAGHPLRPAFLYRARLDAVRRQAAVDGQAIDP